MCENKVNCVERIKLIVFFSSRKVHEKGKREGTRVGM
jgi:hypothetical protein